MSATLKIVIIVLIVLVGALIALYFVGKRLQAKQDERQRQIEAASQTVSMLIIDKKRMRMKNANLPQVVLDSAPKLSKLAKLPIVKAKVGPKVTTLVCDDKVFELLPVKKECKVTVSGIYITGLKSVRGGMDPKPPKQSFFKRIFSRGEKA